MIADSVHRQMPSFGALAKQMAHWTSRSLLTVIVLVAGLGFGRQVLQWWAIDPPQSAAASTPASPENRLGDLGRWHLIQFSNQAWSLRRQTITGDKHVVTEQLRKNCRELLETTHFTSGLPSAKDDRFLTFLLGTTPVAQEPTRWRLYEFHEAFPMSVGIAQLPSPGRLRSEKDNTHTKSSYGIVVWAIAIPSGRQGWMLYMFLPKGTSSDKTPDSTPVPLPPETHGTLALEVADGEGTVAFRGPDRRRDWRRFYDDWFARHDWKTATTWQTTDNAWYAKFATCDGQTSADVCFNPDNRGQCSGLLVLTRNTKK